MCSNKLSNHNIYSKWGINTLKAFLTAPSLDPCCL